MLTATPSSQTVLPGGSAQYTLNLIPINGFDGSGQISPGQITIPSGCATYNFPTFMYVGQPSTLQVTIQSQCTNPHAYTVEVRAASGSVGHSVQVHLDVANTSDFSIGVVSGTQTMPSGGTATRGDAEPRRDVRAAG